MSKRSKRGKNEPRRRFRWVRWLAGGIAGLFLLLVAAILLAPVWLPWAARPVAERWGVSWAEYERIGYGRFSLRDVRYEEENVRFEAEKVEARTPVAWLWRTFFPEDEERLSVRVEDWALQIDELDEPDPEKEDVSIYEIFSLIEENLDAIIRWVPRARMLSGNVRYGEQGVEVRLADWNRGVMTAEVYEPMMEQVVRFEGDLRDGSPYRFSAWLDPFPFETTVVVALGSNGMTIESETSIIGNRVEVSAAFPTEGYVPDEAVFRSEQFRIPSEYFAIEGYEEITGSAVIAWRDEAFRVEIDGEAQPLEGQELLPPVEVKTVARGNRDAIRVESLELSSPWLSASLSDPVVLDYTGRMLSGFSVFLVEADLGAQDFIDLSGRLRGEVQMRSGDTLYPEAEFKMEGEDIAGFGLAVSRLATAGDFSWPFLNVEELEVEMAGERPSFIAARGRVDFAEQSIEGGAIDATVRPPAIGIWLPPEIDFEGFALSAEFDGPWRELRHRGETEVTGVRTEALPYPVDARLDWEGRFADVDRFEIVARTGETSVAVDGSVNLASDLENVSAELDEVVIRGDEGIELESRGATRVAFGWAGEGFSGSVRGLDWRGPAGLLQADGSVDWPGRGDVEVHAEGLLPLIARDFAKADLGRFDDTRVRFTGNWDDGPLQFDVQAESGLSIDGTNRMFLELFATGDGDGLRIDRLRGGTEREPLVIAEGELPASIDFRRQFPLELNLGGKIDFSARTEPEAAFWNEIGKLAGVRVEDPSFFLEVTGTPASPEGEVRALIRRIALVDDMEGISPRIDDLDIHAGFDAEGISLQRGLVFLENQRIEVTGEFPMGREAWQALFEGGEMPDWRQATARILIDEASLAPFASYYPALLSPRGTLDLDLEIRDAGVFGFLNVDDAVTRPLLPLGVIEEASARVRFEGRAAEIEAIRATIGGEEALVTGRVALPIEQDFSFDVRVQGGNLPLARQPGLIVRGDLDLHVRGTADDETTISGDVRLRESFYIAHLRLMPAGAVATPERRPPFFSITQEPINSWRLDVNLRGSRFLNVRGPIFRGLLSASFNLGGTLEEPVALGNVTIDNGTVRFPFAYMRVDQGIISLRQENPYQPQLFIIANTKAFGYDVQMEVAGTAERPVIEFSSTPPLTSEQAMLMVTTGELPLDEFSFTTQQRAGRFAFYLGQNLLYEITGDDRAGERLTVRSGEEISESGRETYSIEYELSDRWSLTGEYNRFDEYTAGFKWNIFSK